MTDRTVAKFMRLVWNALDKYPTCEHDMAPWKPLESALRKLVEERDEALRMRSDDFNAWQYEKERAERAEAEAAALRKEIERAARVMHGEVVQDQGEAFDMCVQILDAALAAKGDK